MRQVGGLETDGMHAARTAQHLPHTAPETHAFDHHPCRRSHFLLRLVCIPKVGKEPAPSGSHEEDGVGSGKAAQVAHVRQVRHEQGVQGLLPQQLRQRFSARFADVAHASARSLSTRARNAISYPATPHPAMIATAPGASTLCRRSGSRAKMFEM
jgi:hypothetical protein